MKVFYRLLNYIKPYKKYLYLSALLLFVSTSILPFALNYLKRYIDYGLKDFKILNTICLIWIGLFTLQGVLTYGYNYLISWVGQKVIIDLRCLLYSHLQFLSLSFFDKRKTGQIMSRITNDVAGLQVAITNALIDMATSSLKIIFLLFYIFYLDWKLASLAILTLPLVSFSFSKFGKKLRKASSVIQIKIADITDILQETLSSMKIVKSFVRENYEINKFRDKNIESFRATMKGVRLSSTFTPLIQIIASFGVISALYIGGYEVLKGVLTPGGLITFIAAVLMIGTPLSILTKINIVFQQAMACAERIFEILDIESEVKENKDAVEMAEIVGNVKFENVYFGYDNEMVLKNVNLEVKAGETIALVGPSGAGKTTIVNLIPRFYDPKEGKILIDGIDIKTVKLESLRKQMGIVPQETILFGGTIKENIAYGKLDAKDEEIIQVAKDANAHDFIIKLKDGYNTIVGERGTRLSGGQRQRIAIARALLKNPKILILDEATSSLDSHSEKLVQDAIEKLIKGRTTFVIAHRLSTIRNSDKIIVIEEGKIRETGSHDELLKNGTLYYTLYEKEEKAGMKI